MSNHILLTTHHNCQLAIFLDSGTPTDIVAESLTRPSLVGSIYLGKVVRVLPSQKIAFVDIGESRTALLHFNDCTKPPTQGETLLVQVSKDPQSSINGDKGARLTTHIRLISRSLIFLPTQKQSVNISKKINDLQTRERLVQTLTNQLQGGVIVRTSAKFVNDFSIEINELNSRWQNILHAKQTHYKSKSPKLLWSELPFFNRVLRDKADKDWQIIVDDDRLAQSLSKDFADLNIIQNNDLQTKFNVEHIITTALSPKIPLPSGGFLVIDEVEAMTVIDVNAGTSNNTQTTNLEAVQAIAHAIRLKNLGGIIVIDFIDMPKSAQAGIIDRLKLAVSNDPMSVQVYEFSRLGLLELTRERERPALSCVLNG